MKAELYVELFVRNDISVRNVVWGSSVGLSVLSIGLAATATGKRRQAVEAFNLNVAWHRNETGITIAFNF